MRQLDVRPARHGPGGGWRPRPPRHRQLPRAGDAPRDPHPRVERAGAGVSERRRNLESSRK